MTPKLRDHMPTTSLWGVAAKWPTRAPKTKLTLCPRDPQGYSRISLSLSGRILEEYQNIVSASKQNPKWTDMISATKCANHGVWEIALTEVLTAQMGVMWCSKKSAHLNCINLIHFRLTVDRLRGSSCIVILGIVIELLQFAATL